MSKLVWGFEGTSLAFAADTDEDGVPSISAKLSMVEIISEIGSLLGGKKDVVEVPVKMLRLTSKGGHIIAELDPNTDGVSVLTLDLNLVEVADEVISAL